VVLARFGFCRVRFRNPPASDLQWKALLGARGALWRDSLRAVRESQPLCRAGGIAGAARFGGSGDVQSAPGSVAAGGAFQPVSGCGTVLVGVARGNHQLSGAGGAAAPADLAAARRTKAT